MTEHTDAFQHPDGDGFDGPEEFLDDDPGDHDALPHIPADDPEFTEHPRGDAGPAGARS
jgi:hypothetical protein